MSELRRKIRAQIRVIAVGRKEKTVQNFNESFCRGGSVLSLDVLGISSMLIHYTLALHFIRMSSFFSLLIAISLLRWLFGK